MISTIQFANEVPILIGDFFFFFLYFVSHNFHILLIFIFIENSVNIWYHLEKFCTPFIRSLITGHYLKKSTNFTVRSHFIRNLGYLESSRKTTVTKNRRDSSLSLNLAGRYREVVGSRYMENCEGIQATLLL